MKLEMARFLKNREQMLYYLARENVVPVKAPPWAKYQFELRRNDKTKTGDPGRHITGRETTPDVIESLGIHDERSCKEVREYIKRLRKSIGYR